MHYTEFQLQQLLNAQEGDTIQQSICLDHLESCSKCQDALSRMAGEGQWLDKWADLAVDENTAENWQFEEELTAQFVPGSSDCNITVALSPEMRREEGNFSTDLSMVSTDFLKPASHPELLGRLGRYDVERLVGAGGFGIVFKAHDTDLRRVVALKVLAPHLMSSGAARRRFERESQAAAAIVHSHVVPIYDVVTDPDVSYLVMQYVSGGSLQERVDKEGPLEVEDALRIGMQIAQGLEAAHKQGVVHRDVKPGNILLEDSVDRVLISDFGLARTADDANLTRSGVITGTPHYMSPEQATGSYIDPRSDLFSLGSVLFFMLTGRPPFRAPQVIAVLNRICTHPHRPVEHVNAKVPLEVAQLVDDLLHKDAEARPQTAGEVASKMQQLLVQQQNGQLCCSSKPRFRVGAGDPKDSNSGFVFSRTFLVTSLVTVAFALGLFIANGQSILGAFGGLVAGGKPRIQKDSPRQKSNDDANSQSVLPPVPFSGNPLGSALPIDGLGGEVEGSSTSLFPAGADVPTPGNLVIKSDVPLDSPGEENNSGQLVTHKKLEAKPKIQIVKIDSSTSPLDMLNNSFRVRQFGILENENQQYVLNYDSHVNKLPRYGDLKTVADVIDRRDAFDFFTVLGYWESSLENLEEEIDQQLDELGELESRYWLKFPGSVQELDVSEESKKGPADKAVGDDQSVKKSGDGCKECDGDCPKSGEKRVSR